MTYTEAKDFINEKICLEVRGLTEKQLEDTKQALTLALDAISKQIPQKLQHSKYEDFNGNKYTKKESYYCPCCARTVFIQNHIEETYNDCKSLNRYPQGEKTTHCKHCGQLLEW